jgi:hypothetical protein
MQLRSRPLDAAEPPRIVFESTAKCADGQHAEAALKEALSRARAPGTEWLVTVHIHKTAARALQADGEITDEAGAAVGHREFTGKATDCEGLAHAVGIWASLVLDAEIRRPRTATAASEQEHDAKSDADSAEQPPGPKARETLPDPALPPDDAPSKRDDPATLELGVGGFIMSGIGGGSALMGATPFLVIAVAKGFFLRPAVAVGESLPAAGPSSTWAAARLDGCFRVTGRYETRRGLQLDMCGGVDAGALEVSSLLLAYVAPGPSIDLSGELGNDFSLVLRGLAGVNVIHDSRLDTPIFSGRGEFGLAWRLQ